MLVCLFFYCVHQSLPLSCPMLNVRKNQFFFGISSPLSINVHAAIKSISTERMPFLASKITKNNPKRMQGHGSKGIQRKYANLINKVEKKGIPI